MSIISLPKEIIRNSNPKFVPNSMIDTLYDYSGFLKSADVQGGIATGISAQKRIAIVGSGAAGLVAAYELSRVPNIHIDIYEAGDKIGGRMDSISIQDPGHNPKIFEMGCMRYPPTSYTLFHYLNKFSLKPVDQFPDPGKVLTTLYYENAVINWPAGSTTPDNPDFKRIGKDFGNMMRYLIGDPNNPDISNPSKLIDYWAIYQMYPTQANKNIVINAWQLIINKYKNTSYHNAIYDLSRNTQIVQRQWTEDDINKFGALGVGSGGFSPLFQIGFLEIIRIIANGWEDNQQFLQEGISSLVMMLEKAIMTTNRTKILKGKKIRKIGKGQAGVYIVSIEGSKVSINYDAVIVATTTRAMEYLGLTVDGDTKKVVAESAVLKQQQKVALRNLHHINSSKFFVTTKTKFWYKENNISGIDLPSNIQTDELMRGLYCLDYDISNQPNQRNHTGMGVVLISYVWGNDSVKMLALSPNERLAQFNNAISKINPLFAKLLNEQAANVTCIDWENTSNYYGAFKLNYPGQEQLNSQVFFQFQDQNQGVFIAGDSVSWAGGWLEGTMTTGVNAACAAAQYLGATVIPNSPLTDISKNMYEYF